MKKYVNMPRVMPECDIPPFVKGVGGFLQAWLRKLIREPPEQFDFRVYSYYFRNGVRKAKKRDTDFTD